VTPQTDFPERVIGLEAKERSWFHPEVLPLLGFGAGVSAVGCLVIGVNLLVTCETKSPGCSYPFQGYGMSFLLVAAWLAIAAYNLLSRFAAHRGWTPHSEVSTNVVCGIMFLGSVMAYFLAMLVLS
jgi:hypothetical protein